MNNLGYLPVAKSSKIFNLLTFKPIMRAAYEYGPSNIAPCIKFYPDGHTYIILNSGDIIIHAVRNGDVSRVVEVWSGPVHRSYYGDSDNCGFGILVNYAMTLAAHTDESDYTKFPRTDMPFMHDGHGLTSCVEKTSEGVTLTLFDALLDERDEDGDPICVTSHQYSLVNKHEGVRYTYAKTERGEGTRTHNYFVNDDIINDCFELLTAILATWF